MVLSELVGDLEGSRLLFAAALANKQATCFSLDDVITNQQS